MMRVSSWIFSTDPSTTTSSLVTALDTALRRHLALQRPYFESIAEHTSAKVRAWIGGASTSAAISILAYDGLVVVGVVGVVVSVSSPIVVFLLEVCFGFLLLKGAFFFEEVTKRSRVCVSLFFEGAEQKKYPNYAMSGNVTSLDVIRKRLKGQQKTTRPKKQRRVPRKLVKEQWPPSPPTPPPAPPTTKRASDHNDVAAPSLSLRARMRKEAEEEEKARLAAEEKKRKAEAEAAEAAAKKAEEEEQARLAAEEKRTSEAAAAAAAPPPTDAAEQSLEVCLRLCLCVSLYVWTCVPCAFHLISRDFSSL